MSTPAPQEDRSAAVRAGVMVILVFVLVLWTALTWPRLILPFTGTGAVAAAIDNDVLYNGAGLTEDEVANIRGAVGVRPIGMIYVGADEPATDRALCLAVDTTIPEVIAVVIRDGELEYVCTGAKVPLLGKVPDDPDMRGISYEIRINQFLRLVENEPVGQAQTAAMVHDSMVKTEKLAEVPRSFRTPWAAVTETVAIVGGVLTAGLVALFGLRHAAIRLRIAGQRRRRLDAARADLDDQLLAIALVVVDTTPPAALLKVPGRSRLAVDHTATAAYLDLANEVERADGGWAGYAERARLLLADFEAGAAARDSLVEQAHHQLEDAGKARRQAQKRLSWRKIPGGTSHSRKDGS